MSVERSFFGRTRDGDTVSIYKINNSHGMEAQILDYGGTIVNLMVPDKNGKRCDIVAGYDDIYDYETDDAYLGAVIGRFGNRINKGKFKLDGSEYNQLFINNGENHLHGGKRGFSHRIWTILPYDKNGTTLLLRYISPDGEEGYPGTLTVYVTYTLTDDNALSINYKATTDKRTIVNLTNHSYFNLSGFASGDILDHILWIDADTYLPTDERLIPTGEIRSVEGTPFDFRIPKKIGKGFDIFKNEDMRKAGGYDHCLNFTENKSFISPDKTNIMEKRIKLSDEKSGRYMEIYTDMPCVQLYTANFLCKAEHPLKGGYPQQKRHALCLETQCMPDSINHNGFTDCTLDIEETYDRTTVFKFGVL